MPFARPPSSAPPGASSSLEKFLDRTPRKSRFSVSIRCSGSTRHDLCFSWVMSFLCEPWPPCIQLRYELFSGTCRLCGELAHPKIRVARVSRLIGNSDTTAKAYGWQEVFVIRWGTL